MVQTQNLKSELPQTLEKQESVCELCGLAPLLDSAYLMSHWCKKVQENHYMPYSILKENKWIS